MAEVVGLNLVKEPKIEVVIGKTTSEWVAAHNPIVFGFQRWDMILKTIEFSGGDYILEVDTIDPSTIITVGDYIYLKSTLYYDGSYEVLAVYSNTITIDFNGDYIADEIGVGCGYIYNASSLTKPAYYLQIDLYKLQPNTRLIKQFKIELDATGYGSINIQEYCKAQLSQFSSAQSYGGQAIKDTTLSNNFQFSYTEKWTTSAESATDYTFYASNAAKQIGDLYGQNMGEYLLYNLAETDGHGKFLTGFDRPTLFIDFNGVVLPFDLSFINMVENVSDDWYYVLTEIDASGGVAATLTGTPYALTNLAGYINRFDFYHFSINDAATLLKWTLYEDMSPKDQAVSEIKYIKIQRVCKNPFHIRWLNSLGGYDYWCFEDAQMFDIENKGGAIIQQYQEDLASSGGSDWFNSRTINKIASVDATQLTTNEFYQLSKIGATVELYRQTDIDGTDLPDKWHKLKLIDVTPQFNNYEPKHSISLKFAMPEINTQRF
jgi:hypothetical protein